MGTLVCALHLALLAGFRMDFRMSQAIMGDTILGLVRKELDEVKVKMRQLARGIKTGVIREFEMEKRLAMDANKRVILEDSHVTVPYGSIDVIANAQRTTRHVRIRSVYLIIMRKITYNEVNCGLVFRPWSNAIRLSPPDF